MMMLGKYKVLQNEIAACDYEYILSEIKKSVGKYDLLISPIASHTLVLANYNKKLKSILDHFDYLVPDSQWLRYSLFFLYGKRLKERVYGPKLTLKICETAQMQNYRLFFYGTTEQTLLKLKERIRTLYPQAKIVGSIPSEFRLLSSREKKIILNKVRESYADILFIGLGSPLQEIFSYELSLLNKNSGRSLIIIPVGAAFDFISGNKRQAPVRMQEFGLEWLFRFTQEPKRLWKRYLLYGLLFIVLVVWQKVKVWVLTKSGE